MASRKVREDSLAIRVADRRALHPGSKALEPLTLGPTHRDAVDGDLMAQLHRKGMHPAVDLQQVSTLRTCREHTGDAIDAETALRIGLVSRVCPAAELSDRVEEYATKFQHIPANQLALNKLLINQAFENMGLRTTQLLGTLFDGITRHTEEAYRWAESFSEKGFRTVISERDAPWGDYGERKK